MPLQSRLHVITCQVAEAEYNPRNRGGNPGVVHQYWGDAPNVSAGLVEDLLGKKEEAAGKELQQLEGELKLERKIRNLSLVLTPS